MIVEIILIVLAAYLVSGFVFAILFITKGVNKIDDGAHDSTVGFRIIIIPGAIVFWPLLLKKWLTSNKKKLQ